MCVAHSGYKCDFVWWVAWVGPAEGSSPGQESGAKRHCFGDHLSYSSEILKHIPFMANIWSPAKTADGAAWPRGAWPPRSGLPLGGVLT